MLAALLLCGLLAVGAHAEDVVAVRFDTAGGTGGPEDAAAELGGSYVIPPEKPMKSGYTFYGWGITFETDAFFGWDVYRPGDVVSDIPHDLEPTAVWAQNAAADTRYVVRDASTYFTDDYYAFAPAKSGTYKFIYTKTMLAMLEDDAGDCIYDGSDLEGKAEGFYDFSVDLIAGEIYFLGLSRLIEGPASIESISYIPGATYTITYNTKGGTGGPTPQVGIEAGTTVTLSTTAPKREAYVFKGWAATDGGTAVITSIAVNANTTVYAVWEPFTPPSGPSDKLLGFFIDFFAGGVEIATVATWIARYLFFGWLWGQWL